MLQMTIFTGGTYPAPRAPVAAGPRPKEEFHRIVTTVAWVGDRVVVRALDLTLAGPEFLASPKQRRNKWTNWWF